MLETVVLENGITPREAARQARRETDRARLTARTVARNAATKAFREKAVCPFCGSGDTRVVGHAGDGFVHVVCQDTIRCGKQFQVQAFSKRPRVQYRFPKNVKCPQCGWHETKEYYQNSTEGVQDRKCRACKTTFRVKGEPIE